LKIIEQHELDLLSVDETLGIEEEFFKDILLIQIYMKLYS